MSSPVLVKLVYVDDVIQVFQARVCGKPTHLQIVCLQLNRMHEFVGSCEIGLKCNRLNDRGKHLSEEIGMYSILGLCGVQSRTLIEFLRRIMGRHIDLRLVLRICLH